MSSINMSNLTLLRLRMNDLDSIILESEKSFLPSVNNPQETANTLFSRFSQDPLFAIYGYKIEGDTVSYITTLSYQDFNSVSIWPMFVSNKVHGKGIGKKQVLDFINLYKNKGTNAFFTKTWQNNNASIKIFIDLGFKEIKRHPNDRIDGDSTIDYLLSNI